MKRDWVRRYDHRDRSDKARQKRRRGRGTTYQLHLALHADRVERRIGDYLSEAERERLRRALFGVDLLMSRSASLRHGGRLVRIDTPLDGLWFLPKRVA